MPLSGGWPDFGLPVDPRYAVWDRIRASMAAAAEEQERAEAQAARDWAEEQAKLDAAQPDYRTSCPACFLAMCEEDVDVDLNVERPSLCGHHLRELGKMVMLRRLTTAFVVNLNDWVTRARR